MKKLCAIAAVVIGFAAPAAADTVAGGFTSFFALGDSLTDDGKLGAGVLAAPSDGGRFSNGPTWAELVAKRFSSAGLSTANFALGGATAQGPDLTPAAGLGRLSTLSGQIGAIGDSLSGLTTGNNPLTAVWFGANDLFSSFESSNVIAAAEAVETGIRNIAAVGQTLGVELNDFLVPNLPDLGASPRYGKLLELGGATPAEIAFLSGQANAATDLFNTELSARMDTLRSEGLNILDLDTNTLFADLLDAIKTAPGSAEAYGLLDADTPCTVSLSAPLSGQTNPFTCAPGTENLLLFSDAVHPNAIGHQVLAENTRVAPVPLPASASLMVIGLAGLGFAARRRRAA